MSKTLFDIFHVLAVVSQYPAVVYNVLHETLVNVSSRLMYAAPCPYAAVIDGKIISAYDANVDKDFAYTYC